MKRNFGKLTFLASLVIGLYGQTVTEPLPFVQSFRQISVAGNGVIFGLNDFDEIFTWTGQDWTKLEGKLRQISAGSMTEVWGVNSLNKVYRATSNGWQEQPGPMKMVAVAKGGGAVVSLDPQGRPFAWNGAGWTPFPNAPVLEQIAIGTPERIYGVGPGGEIYRWRPNQSAWTRLKGSLKKISVAADGTVTGVNETKKGYIQKDADIEAELNKQFLQSAWVAMDQNLTAIESLDVKTSIVIDKYGFLIQRPTSISSSGQIVLDGNMVVDGNFVQPAPAQFTTGDNVTYKAGECVVLKGTLKLKLSNPPPPERALSLKPATCLTGTFKSVPPPDPAEDYPPHKVSGLTTLLGLLGKSARKSTGDLGRSSDYTSADGPKVCDATHIRNMSHKSFVEFQLPDGAENQQIRIDAGAYNNYVFPACNRVWWDNLVFTCNRNGQWQKTSGNYDADALCHGITPDSPYIKVGNR